MKIKKFNELNSNQRIPLIEVAVNNNKKLSIVGRNLDNGLQIQIEKLDKISICSMNLTDEDVINLIDKLNEYLNGN